MSNLNFNDGKPLVVLAADTSSACSGFALARGSELIASLQSQTSEPHSRTFFLQTSELLKRAGMKLSDIQVFAAATGPGSFTGLRVGLAAVKGFAHSLGKPAIGVNSIDALALGSKAVGNILVLIAAGRNEVYSGVRRVEENGKLISLGTDQVGSLASVLNSELRNQSLSVVGAISKEALAEIPNWTLRGCQTSIAEEIALWVPALFLDEAVYSLRPDYIRPSDAELNRKA